MLDKCLSTQNAFVESLRRLLLHPQQFGSDSFCSRFLSFRHISPTSKIYWRGREDLAWHSQLGGVVLLVKVTNFTKNQFQSRSLCDCDGSRHQQDHVILSMNRQKQGHHTNHKNTTYSLQLIHVATASTNYNFSHELVFPFRQALLRWLLQNCLHLQDPIQNKAPLP